MWARLTTVKVDPSRRDEGIAFIHEHVLPAVRDLQGFQGGYWLLSEDSSRSVAVTLWDSRESLEASAQAVGRLREQGTQQSGVQFESVESMEVVGQA